MAQQFADRQIYGGTIVDQTFFKTKDGKFLFKLVVSLDREVENAYKGVSRPLDATYEKDVVIDLNTTDPNQLTWRMADLQRLGLTGTDIGVLQPGTPGHQSFVGKRILVSCRLQARGAYTNEYWNLWFPKKSAREVNGGTDAPVSADDVRNALGKHAAAAANRASARDAANAATGMGVTVTPGKGALAADIPF